MERRRREREEGKGRWAESLRNPANVVKDTNWLKKKQGQVLKDILDAKGPLEKCTTFVFFPSHNRFYVIVRQNLSIFVNLSIFQFTWFYLN